MKDGSGEKLTGVFLRQVIDSMTDAVFFKDLEGKYIGCNHVYEKMTGRKEADIIGKTAPDLDDAESAKIFTDSDKMIFETGKPVRIEVWIDKADGARALMECKKSPLFDDHGKIIGILGVFHEITKQRGMDDALKASEEKYRMIAENTTDAIWLYNLDQDKFTYYSPSVKQLIGFSPDEIMQRKILETVSPGFVEMVSARIAEAKKYLAENPAKVRREIVEIKQPTWDGGDIWVEVSARMRFNVQNEKEILGVSRNIEDRKKTENEITYLGYHDQLTGLYNRHYFENILPEAEEKSDRYNEPLSMLMLDLDHFKKVNDIWGHQIGDEILKMFAKVIKSRVRDSDKVFRFGGEEFVILMPHTKKEGAAEAAEEIRVAIEKENHPIAGIRTVSIGVAERMHSEAFRHWYRRVDEALYLAKTKGRNCVVIADEIENRIADSVRIAWQAEWESGSKDLDRQHTELVDMANRLINMAFAGFGYQETEQYIDALLIHTNNHFKFEERVLVLSGYPAHQAHADIHKNLLAKAKQLKESFKNGDVMLSAIFTFLVEEVILGHIMTEDTKYFSYTAGKKESGPS